MQISSSLFYRMKGKAGNLIFFNRRGKIYVRSRPLKVCNPRTPLQQVQRNRLSDVMNFYSIVCATPLKVVWLSAARSKMMIGANLFVRENIGAFDGNGSVFDYSQLHFSSGKLPGCDCLDVEYDALVNCLDVSWKNPVLRGAARDADLLGIVVVFDQEGFELLHWQHLKCKRSDASAKVCLAAYEAEPSDAWCFFADQEGKAFSKDTYRYLA